MGGAWVVARLDQLVPLCGSAVEVHAGEVYAEAITGPLRAAGAEPRHPLAGLRFGEQLGWYATSDPPGRSPAPSSSVDTVDVARLMAGLSDPARAQRLDRITGSDVPATPGLYSWWVDPVGAEHLSVGLGQALTAGLIYAGPAGATRWPSGKPSANTLRGRLLGMHRDGNVGTSTFRLTLASALDLRRTDGGSDEHALTDWMKDHLSVVALPIADADTLSVVEGEVLQLLDPPLNLMGMPKTPLRQSLSSLRASSPRRPHRG